MRKIAAHTLAALTIFGCGNPADPGSDAGLERDAGDAGDTGFERDAGHAADAGAICTPDLACVANPNPTCSMGRTSCTTGVETCVDAEAVSDGVTCPTGLCTNGVCRGPATIDVDIDISTLPAAPGSSCATGSQFIVRALTARTAALTLAPEPGCLGPGDETLLINLQGAPGAIANVGNWELLQVDSIAGDIVTFTTDKLRFYGDAADSDGGVDTTQHVALIRVPQFGQLIVEEGATVSAPPWDGALGGVVALRAASLDLRGSIDATALGYRSGAWSVDRNCRDSLPTFQGESITGAGEPSQNNNAGGSGGLAGAMGSSFSGNTPVCATAGHAVAGVAGTNPGMRAIGDPGQAYGVDDGTRLTMGSGAGGNLTCRVDAVGTAYTDRSPKAGGIVLLFVEQLEVASTATISATASNDVRDVAASGGYVFIRGGDLSIGTDRVTAVGAVALGGSVSTATVALDASPGYVVLESTGVVTGTSDPPANVISR